MKRLLVLCCIVAALLALASSAFAATSAGITVTVTLQNVAMTLDTASWDIGALAAGAAKTSSTFHANNTGNVAEDFSIATTATTPGAWAPGGSSAVNQYWLQAGSTTVGTVAVSLATNVAAGGNAPFTLTFTAPAAGSAVNASESFTVTVSAAAH